MHRVATTCDDVDAAMMHANMHRCRAATHLLHGVGSQHHRLGVLAPSHSCSLAGRVEVRPAQGSQGGHHNHPRHECRHVHDTKPQRERDCTTTTCRKCMAAILQSKRPHLRAPAAAALARGRGCAGSLSSGGDLSSSLSESVDGSDSERSSWVTMSILANHHC
jgi:hypothetical protein